MKNHQKIMKIQLKVGFFEFWSYHFYFYAKIQSAGPIPTPKRVMICRTKVLLWNTPPARGLRGTASALIWTLSLLYTSADKYKSMDFHEKLLTLISCNFLSFGNSITFFVSANTSSSSSFEWILQILRISKLSRRFPGMKWAQFGVLARAPP